MSSAATAGLSRSPPSVTMPARRAEGASGEDVADRPRARLVAGVDDEHLAGRDRLDRPLLGVQLAVSAADDVFAHRDVAHGVGDTDHPQVGAGRSQAAA